jgi:hypothetical protein
MMKRSYFLALAAGLCATLAFAQPSQAGPILVDTTASFTITSPPGATADDFSFTYNSTVISTPAVLVSAPAGTTIADNGTNTVTITMVPPTGGPASFEWKFTDAVDAGPIGVVLAFVFSGTPTEFGATTKFEVVNSGVPEPASLGLLGIGMTGLLAFRRFFKKTSVA